ncbi:MAG: nucleotidyltransferase domain-containing protein [Pseudomonadales bacterium]
MSERLFLEARHREAIKALLREHLPGIEAWVYGSRINGRAHGGSDLDIALRSPNLAKIPADKLASFEKALHDSSIPFLVEARDWARLPENFHQEIERDHVVL